MDRDAVSFYLNAAGRVPLLTAAEEITLGHSVQAMMRLLDEKPEGPYSLPEKRTLRTGKRAKDRMILANLRLVTLLAKKYKHRCQTLDMADLLQEGVIGLIRGVEKFDPGKGYKFSTYAYWWIRQGVGRAVSQMDRTIRLPINAIDVLTKARYFVPRFTEAHGRAPTIEEIAKECGVTVYVMTSYLAHNNQVRSLDEKATGSEMAERSALIDLMACDRETPWEYAEKEASRETFGVLKHFTQQSLTPKEQEIIQLRFPMLDEESGAADFFSVAQQEVSKKLGVSRQYIAQCEKRAIYKLRVNMALATA